MKLLLCLATLLFPALTLANDLYYDIHKGKHSPYDIHKGKHLVFVTHWAYRPHVIYPPLEVLLLDVPSNCIRPTPFNYDASVDRCRDGFGAFIACCCIPVQFKLDEAVIEYRLSLGTPYRPHLESLQPNAERCTTDHPPRVQEPDDRESQQGACSDHGGIDHEAGCDDDGSVICKDGWRDSTVKCRE